ncbi:MAG: hypothetical protein GX359_08715 [Clostridiales bacterium]|mgnify:CR=1 FL=1|nr:hypothetical protein [Clostridiales bacterium]
MKKYIIITVSFFLFLFMGVIVFNIFYPRVDIYDTKASLTYVYNDKSIKTQLTDEESLLLKEIFNNKKLRTDNPSCGFTENISISFNDLVFCIACDDCPIVKLGKKYFKISKSDRETVEQIFKKYGGSFPCV